MAGDPSRAQAARRFLLMCVGLAVVVTALGRVYGEDLAVWAQGTPTTERGWLFIGWLIGGPPYLLAYVTWNEYGRIRPGRRVERLWIIAAWIALSMLLVPAWILGDEEQFGAGRIASEPVMAGWQWAMLAHLVAAAFAGVLALVRRGTTVTERQQRLTRRFVERAWAVLLLIALGMALYSGPTGLFRSGA